MSQDRFSHFTQQCLLSGSGWAITGSGRICTKHVELDLGLTGIVQMVRLAQPSRSQLALVVSDLAAVDRLWIEAGFLAARDGRLAR